MCGIAAHAATITVTTTADSVDAAGGNCSTIALGSLPGPNGLVSLREAVCAANNNAGADIIAFSVNGIFVLTGAANEDLAASGDLDLTQSIIIQGNGAANTIIDGGGIERIFDFFPSAASTFDLFNVTLRNGDTRATGFVEGGAMYLHNNVTTTITGCSISNNFSGANGAIENRGSLTINNSVVANNQTIPPNGSVVGGGIRTAGPTSINNTTVANNTVRGEGGGITATVETGVTVTITNSTISGNTASVTGGGLGNGGGISTTGNQGAINVSNCTISGNRADNTGGGAYFVTPAGQPGNSTFTNVTVTNNTADNDNNGTGVGGGIAQNTAAVTLRNTIVAGNFNSIASVRDDVNGALVAASSHNLIGDGTGSSGLTNGTNNNQVGSSGAPINPLLGALGNNGGVTQTHALLAGSPAADRANNANAPATDQRGVARPVDGDAVAGAVADIGSYEAQVAATTAASRKNHGGTNFDVDLPFTGAAGIEPRVGGATNDYTIVVAFTVNVRVAGSPQAQVIAGAGTVGSGGVSNGGAVTVGGNLVTIPLTNVTSEKTIQVRLNLVNGSTNVTIPMRVLPGDVNGDAVVNSGDATVTRARSGQNATPANFRADVNADGTINVGDASIVRARSGQFVP